MQKKTRDSLALVRGVYHNIFFRTSFGVLLPIPVTLSLLLFFLLSFLQCFFCWCKMLELIVCVSASLSFFFPGFNEIAILLVFFQFSKRFLLLPNFWVYLLFFFLLDEDSKTVILSGWFFPFVCFFPKSSVAFSFLFNMLHTPPKHQKKKTSQKPFHMGSYLQTILLGNWWFRWSLFFLLFHSRLLLFFFSQSVPSFLCEKRAKKNSTTEVGMLKVKEKIVAFSLSLWLAFKNFLSDTALWKAYFFDGPRIPAQN